MAPPRSAIMPTMHRRGFLLRLLFAAAWPGIRAMPWVIAAARAEFYPARSGASGVWGFTADPAAADGVLARSEAGVVGVAPVDWPRLPVVPDRSGVLLLEEMIEQ